MKISVSLLLILWINSFGPAYGSLSLIAQLGRAMIPGLCDALNKNTIPSFIKDIYDSAMGGLVCNPFCVMSNGNYVIEGGCDSSDLSDADKASFCKNGLQVIESVTKIIGCPAFNCTINADGNIFYTATCPPPVISLPSIL